jgi:hypothetical protein
MTTAHLSVRPCTHGQCQYPHRPPTAASHQATPKHFHVLPIGRSTNLFEFAWKKATNPPEQIPREFGIFRSFSRSRRQYWDIVFHDRRWPVYASAGSQSPHLGICCRFHRQPYMFASGRVSKNTVNIKSNISEQIPIVVRRQKKKTSLFLFIRNISDVKHRSLKAGMDLRQSEIYCLGA